MKPAPARDKLAELVAATRPDWDQDVLSGALDQAARHPEWSWERVLAEVPRLLCVEDSTPWDLATAVRATTAKAAGPSVPPADFLAARQQLAARLSGES